jgi:hypothetical protein
MHLCWLPVHSLFPQDGAREYYGPVGVKMRTGPQAVHSYRALRESDLKLTMQLGLDKVAPYSSYDELERRLLCEDILHLGMGAKNMGWYGHAKPAGTALQRHLFTMVKQLKQYSAVYIKQPGEATPAECTPLKLLFSARFWSAVTQQC